MKLQLAIIAGIGAMGFAGIAEAVTVDGSLDASYGSTPLVTQINVSDSHTGGSGPGAAGPTARPGMESGGGTNPNEGYTQLSNMYANISGGTLNVFIGGSLDNYDSAVDIAIQSNGSGVSDLSGSTFGGTPQDTIGNATDDIAFKGFKPNAFLEFAPTYNGATPPGSLDNQIGNIRYVNLSTDASSAAASTLTGFSAALNNSLNMTLIGTGLSGSPSFASATTGLEFSVPLADLGSYAAGTNVELSAFVIENSGTAVNNQTLAPFSYFTDGGGNQTNSSGALLDTSAREDSSDYDYSYIDHNRQFTGTAYTNSVGFVTVSVPEPASLGLLGLTALAALRRRSHATA